MSSDHMSCPITVKTSKEWVLPPRPKPGRKPTDMQKKEKKKPMIRGKTSGGPGAGVDGGDVGRNIAVVERENAQLKSHLLSLINEYRHLKQMVLNKPAIPAYIDLESTNSTARKRSFTEIHDSMSELITNMNELTHDAPEAREEPAGQQDDLMRFINYDHLLDDDIVEEDDELIESPQLSRTSSPVSDMENSLMATLTRSTTVSTAVSTVSSSGNDKKPFRFYDLPPYSNDDYTFKFDQIDPNSKELMSVIQEDRYNMVTDLLEEKLIKNDLNYYEEQKHNM